MVEIEEIISRFCDVKAAEPIFPFQLILFFHLFQCPDRNLGGLNRADVQSFRQNPHSCQIHLRCEEALDDHIQGDRGQYEERRSDPCKGKFVEDK